MQTIKNLFFIVTDNLNYFGILVLLFLAVAFLVFAGFRLLINRRTATEARLDKLVDSGAENQRAGDRPKFLDKEQGGLAGRLAKPLHKLSSMDQRGARQKMRLRLIQAGYQSDKAIYNYLAAKILLPLAFIGFYLLTRIYYKFASEAILAIVLLILLGYFTPTLWVWLMTKARQERIFKGLPDALDLMVVCVESGLGLDMTFKRVGEEIRPMCKDLADEFNLTTLEIRAGMPRSDAFKNMVLRTGVSEINSLMTVLSQTSRFGTSLATALRVHADSMRIKRRQMAEETAAKAAVKLIFPLVLFIFPAILVVLVGPGVIKIVKYLFPVLGG